MVIFSESMLVNRQDEYIQTPQDCNGWRMAAIKTSISRKYFWSYIHFITVNKFQFYIMCVEHIVRNGSLPYRHKHIVQLM